MVTRRAQRRAVRIGAVCAMALVLGACAYLGSDDDAASTTVPAVVDPTATSASVPAGDTTIAATPSTSAITVAPTSTTTTTTTVPPTTTIPPPLGVDELVLTSTALGQARMGTDPDQVVSYVSAILGSPTSDTGWVTPESFVACEGTTVILDHFGTPVGVGRWAGRRDEVWEGWRPRMAALATCENVVVKLGGLAMPDNGYGWDTAERPPSSDEMLAAQGDWYRATIDEFGPHRCMFESNFPVDRWSLSYRTVWNAFKKIAAEYSTSEAADLLGGTARRIYSI